MCRAIRNYIYLKLMSYFFTLAQTVKNLSLELLITQYLPNVCYMHSVGLQNESPPDLLCGVQLVLS